MKKGLIHIYTGDGKGKTTASLGLALRAVGQGFKVCMIQFMKGGAYTGEYVAARNYLPHFEIFQFGRPCIKQLRQMKIKGYVLGKTRPEQMYDVIREDIECGTCRYCFLNDDVQRDYIEEGFKKALEVVMDGHHDLVILDEINVAVSLGFLNVELVLNMLANKPESVELVLTGRNVPDEIVEMADLVTEMKLHKHYYEKGVSARRGIEY